MSVWTERRNPMENRENITFKILSYHMAYGLLLCEGVWAQELFREIGHHHYCSKESGKASWRRQDINRSIRNDLNCQK